LGNKIKILVLVPSPNTPGGVGHYYSKIKPHLKSEVTYFVRGVRNQRSSFSRLLFPLTQVYDTIRFLFFLLVGRYSLVHVNTSFGLTGIYRDAIFIFLTRIFRKQFIVFFRGIDNEFIVQIEKKHWRIFKTSFLKAKVILVLSNWMKEKLLEWNYQGDIILETTTVDSKLLKAFNIENSVLKHKRSEPVEILFLSRLEKAKGIYEAIDAFRIINGKYPNTIFRICGDGNETTKVLEYVGNDLGKSIFFEGFIAGAKKIEALTKAHIFLFPSYAEGMPNALLEAIAFGLPIVTSDVGGIPDFFVEPQMGFITHSIQPEVLASLMEKLIVNPEECIKIGRYNFEFAKNRFYAENVADRLDSYYSKLIEC